MPEKVKKTGEMEEIIELMVKDDQPVVSSLLVAKHFEKRHDNVLRDIESLAIPEEFNALNFEPVNYVDAKGESRPAVNMTRDGFTLLAMGFTGKKAMTWKLRYIEAFNAMEKELRIRSEPPSVTPRYNYLPADPEAVRALEGLIDYWSFLEGFPREEAIKQILAFTRSTSLKELNTVSVLSSFYFVQACLCGTDKTEDRTPCPPDELRPLLGLMDYWQYKVEGSTSHDIQNIICKRCRTEALEQIPACDIARVVHFTWGRLQYELGYQQAVRDHREWPHAN